MKYIKKFNESKEEITSEEGKKFLNIIRQKLPNKINKYMSLIGNKGLDYAKKDFEINDPDEIKRKEIIETKRKIKEESKVLYNNDKMHDYEFDMLVHTYLKTDSCKEWFSKNSYPHIDNFPKEFKTNKSIKNQTYHIEYISSNNNEKELLRTKLIFEISKREDSINITCDLKIEYNIVYELIYLTLDKRYNENNLEKCIIDFLKFLKENILQQTNIINIYDINKLSKFVEILKEKDFVKVEKYKEYKNLIDNNDFSFLYKIPLSHYRYNDDIIYLYIGFDYTIIFHEQYAKHVYNIYKKLTV